jgi:hypothetical protein
VMSWHGVYHVGSNKSKPVSAFPIRWNDQE